MKFNIGDKVFIDGVVPARVLGRWMNYIVVDLHPFYISGTFNRIEPTKAATVSKLIVHPENLTIESKARPEKLAAEMQDPTQSESVGEAQDQLADEAGWFDRK